jgi:hypothetical protein
VVDPAQWICTLREPPQSFILYTSVTSSTAYSYAEPNGPLKSEIVHVWLWPEHIYDRVYILPRWILSRLQLPKHCWFLNNSIKHAGNFVSHLTVQMRWRYFMQGTRLSLYPHAFIAKQWSVEFAQETRLKVIKIKVKTKIARTLFLWLSVSSWIRFQLRRYTTAFSRGMRKHVHRVNLTY